MKRSYSILPPFRSPWRYDLYQALFSALLVAPNANRGEGRARELYHQAQIIAEKTGEELSLVVWALATFEYAITHSAAGQESFPSSHSSPLSRTSGDKAFVPGKHPQTRNPSSQSSHCSQPNLWG